MSRGPRSVAWEAWPSRTKASFSQPCASWWQRGLNSGAWDLAFKPRFGRRCGTPLRPPTLDLAVGLPVKMKHACHWRYMRVTFGVFWSSQLSV